MIYITNFMKIGLGIQKSMWVDSQTETGSMLRNGTYYHRDMYRVARDVDVEFIVPNSKYVVIYFRFCFVQLRVMVTKL
jgi:hypothetical protein